MLKNVHLTEKIYGQFLPKRFFIEIFNENRDLIMSSHHANQSENALLKILTDFLTRKFDVESFESVFVIWDSQLRNHSFKRVRHNCLEIIKSYHCQEG
jgi:hypothetical protein